MFNLNLKIAWRNLIKNKYYTLFNISGLAFGLAGTILILVYIKKETGYDKWNEGLDRTYMVAGDYMQNGTVFKGSKINGLFSQVAETNFPELEAVSIGNFNGRDVKLRRQNQKQEEELKWNSLYIDQNFFKAYPLQSSIGDFNTLFTDKQGVVVSSELAKRYFGDKNPVGQILTLNMGANYGEQNLLIKAVWEKEKYPSYFGMDVLFYQDLSVYGDEFATSTFSTMLRLREGTNKEALFSKLRDAYVIALAKYYSKDAGQVKMSIAQAMNILKVQKGITSFKLIDDSVSHLNLGNFYESDAKQNMIYVLLSLAGFLILISCINYVNMALVLANERGKEVGVKKVLGAFRSNLISQFFIEVSIQAISALVLALIVAELFLPTVNTWTASNLSLFGNPNFATIALQILGIVLSVIILSTTYPALIISNFKLTNILKGGFATSPRIGTLRKVLVGVQFTVALAIVIGFLVINAQLKFMRDADLGLKPNQLMSLTIKNFKNRNLSPAQFETIKTRLLNIKGVEAVSRATEAVVNDSGFSDDISYQQNTITTESRFVDPNYFEVIGGRIFKGRDFSYKTLATDSVSSVILNQTAYKKLQLGNINQTVSIKGIEEKLNVVGVVNDIQAYSFEQETLPTIYLLRDYPFHWRKNIIIRLSGVNIAETISTIKDTWKTIEPEFIPSYTFADEEFQKMNKSYEISGQIVFYFGLLTIMISLFGLIAIATYTAKVKSKELAIRSILGASIANLLTLLNSKFMAVVVTACVMADLVAYLLMKEWFAHFVRKIEMPWQLFIYTNLIIITISIIVISLQSLRVIRQNPATVLKYE